jgi:hypothetical protein
VSNELVDTIKAYLNGDVSKLKWLIEFRITRSRFDARMQTKKKMMN